MTKKGDPRPAGAGMQKGTTISIHRNAVQRFNDVITDAAGDIGYDGKGMDGFRGWLRKQAQDRPADYLVRWQADAVVPGHSSAADNQSVLRRGVRDRKASP
jgi:hypothetical protein